MYTESYGYDVEEISTMYKGLSEAYSDLINSVGGELQGRVIDPIGGFWYAKEAQETGDAVTKVINGEFTIAIRDTYNNVIGYLEGIAKNWAELTHNTPVSNPYGNATAGFQTNRDTIKETLNDKFVGINGPTASEYTSGLPAVSESIKAKISETYSKIRSLTPFIGGGQEEALQQLFQKLNNTVSDMFSFIIDGTTGENSTMKLDDTSFQGMKKAIEEWTAEYSERAKQAANAIKGDGSSTGV